MNRTYEDIPKEGEHRKGSVEEEPSTSVRAQDPVLPLHKSKDDDSLRRQNETARSLHARVWRHGDGEDGFEELGHYESDGDFQKAIENLPDTPRFVVFENLETGEVFYDQDSGLGGDWTGGGRFDRVTIFDDSAEAAAYVEKRSKE